VFPPPAPSHLSYPFCFNLSCIQLHSFTPHIKQQLRVLSYPCCFRNGHTCARRLGVSLCLPATLFPHTWIPIVHSRIRYDTLIVGGSGVTSTVMAWGDVLLQRGGKTRTRAGADVAVATLG
jgi:hypothetical protein